MLADGTTWRGLWLGFQADDREPNARGVKGGEARITVPGPDFPGRAVSCYEWCLCRPSRRPVRIQRVGIVSEGPFASLPVPRGTMQPSLVTTLRWNSETREYDRIDHEIDLDNYPGAREYASPEHGEGLIAFPYGINDTPRELREQVRRYSALWGRELGRVGQCQYHVNRARAALEAGDMDALREALETAYRV